MHTLQEIQAQPDIWRTIIPALEASHLPKLAADRTLVFSGCGSAYYLGLTCAAFIRQRAKALPASEIIFFPEHHISPDTTLLVASRSGKS
ncbi:MAG: SIS domain-containing protein, partial [Anaerolineales bacterium]